MAKPKKLLILGAGDGISSVINVAYACGYEIAGLVSPDYEGEEKYGFSVYKDEFALDLDQFDLCLGIGLNAIRQTVYKKIIARFPDARFPTLIHPTANIAHGVEIDDGSILFPNAMVGAYTKIGKFCWINTRASMDHDGVMADFSALAPGSITGGQVSLGARSVLSLGSKVKHGVSIGKDTVIGAASYVHHDIGDNIVAYGSPAKVIRPREAHENYY